MPVGHVLLLRLDSGLPPPLQVFTAPGDRAPFQVRAPVGGAPRHPSVRNYQRIELSSKAGVEGDDLGQNQPQRGAPPRPERVKCPTVDPSVDRSAADHAKGWLEASGHYGGTGSFLFALTPTLKVLRGRRYWSPANLLRWTPSYAIVEIHVREELTRVLRANGLRVAWDARTTACARW